MIRQIEPWIGPEELHHLQRIGETTYVTEGPLTEEFESRIRELTGAEHVISYTNGTLAQFAILRALGIGAGDEVIVPDMTFIATANAVVLTGATPVLCDVNRATLALDAGGVKTCLSNRTKAIVPVHLYGGMAGIEEIIELAEPRDIVVVEDAAQAVGVRCGGRHAGTFGRAGYLSFYGNKTMTTGEGAVILTDDAELALACYRLKNHGRDQKGVFKHDHVGFNFCFTDVQAAIGLGQLDKLPEIIRRKRDIRKRYMERLGNLERLTFQAYPDGVEFVPWFTNLFLDSLEGLVSFLASREIETRRFFYPLHRQPCYDSNDVVRKTDCPVSHWLYLHGLSLPSSAMLTDGEMDTVCQGVIEFFGEAD